MDEILSIVLQETYTFTDALRRAKVLRQFLMHKLFGGIDDKNAYRQDDIQWLDGLGGQFYSQFTKDNFYGVLKQLEDSLHKFQPLVIYVPFEMPEHEIARLGNYLRQAYGKNFLIEVKIDPSLIAGCALVWGGLYQDYSIRKRISSNKEAIISLMQQSFKR